LKQAYHDSLSTAGRRVKILLAFCHHRHGRVQLDDGVHGWCHLLRILCYPVGSLQNSPWCMETAARDFPLWVSSSSSRFFKNKYTGLHGPLVVPLRHQYLSQSVEFACILAVKFSSASLHHPVHRPQNCRTCAGASRSDYPQRLPLPRHDDPLSLRIRYIFRKVNETLKTKCFDTFDHHLPYRYRLPSAGFIPSHDVIRSYEQGERSYQHALPGLREDSHLL